MGQTRDELAALHREQSSAPATKTAEVRKMLTDFSTSNGPQLRVLLVGCKRPKRSKRFQFDRRQEYRSGGTEGTQGDQRYQIPIPVDLQTFNTVTIYCENFRANFGFAQLEEFWTQAGL